MNATLGNSDHIDSVPLQQLVIYWEKITRDNSFFAISKVHLLAHLKPGFITPEPTSNDAKS